MSENRFSVVDKVALVTGASSGLGAHFCKTLAGEGAKVVACARRKEKLQALVDEVSAQGSSIISVPMDVNNPDDIKNAFDTVNEQWGCPDIVCNNAGIGLIANFLNMEQDLWDSVINTDLTSVYRVGREAALRMQQAGKCGSIINIASILGFQTSPVHAAYATAKAGVVQLTRTMALDLQRYNIRTNAIAPGYFITEMTDESFQGPAGEARIARMPAKRLGELEELDGALLLLASDASSFMNGSTITVDGAHSVKLV